MVGVDSGRRARRLPGITIEGVRSRFGRPRVVFSTVERRPACRSVVVSIETGSRSRKRGNVEKWPSDQVGAEFPVHIGVHRMWRKCGRQWITRGLPRLVHSSPQLILEPSPVLHRVVPRLWGPSESPWDDRRTVPNVRPARIWSAALGPSCSMGVPSWSLLSDVRPDPNQPGGSGPTFGPTSSPAGSETDVQINVRPSGRRTRGGVTGEVPRRS